DRGERARVGRRGQGELPLRQQPVVLLRPPRRLGVGLPHPEHLMDPIMHPSFHADEAPDRVAVVAEPAGQQLTYGQLEERTNRVAQLLRSLGLREGDNVALVLENRAEFFEVEEGALRMGLYVTPINWHLAPEEAAYIVEDCGASVLFVSA